MNTIAQYCQKCRTPNESGEVNCRACGTRLMIVVFPPSIRHDESIVPSYYEDHLLERVSLLELRLVQMAEFIKNAHEFVRQESEKYKKDHEFLQVFFETIEKMNPDFANEISKNFLAIREEKKAKAETKNRRERILKEILEAHDNKQAELFTHLVNEGIRLLEENEEKQAFLNLERAALLSTENVPLMAYIGESYFRADKIAEARTILDRGYLIAPYNEKILMLLGSILADIGENESARKLLGILSGNPQFSVCVNYIWGMLAASEKSWTESLAAFKEAANTQETAEILYLIGAVYFQLGQVDNAINYLKKTTDFENRFADAWYLQSLIFQQKAEFEKAEEMRRMASEAKEAGAQCLEFLRKKNFPESEAALPFLHFGKEKKFLSKGSLRLTKFFREQVLKSIE